MANDTVYLVCPVDGAQLLIGKYYPTEWQIVSDSNPFADAMNVFMERHNHAHDATSGESAAGFPFLLKTENELGQVSSSDGTKPIDPGMSHCTEGRSEYELTADSVSYSENSETVKKLSKSMDRMKEFLKRHPGMTIPKLARVNAALIPRTVMHDSHDLNERGDSGHCRGCEGGFIGDFMHPCMAVPCVNWVEDLRAQLWRVCNSYVSQDPSHPRIQLLERIIHGKAFCVPGHVEETVEVLRQKGLIKGRTTAIHTVTSLLALLLPEGTLSFEVIELLRPCLQQTDWKPESESYWLKIVADYFERAVVRRKEFDSLPCRCGHGKDMHSSYAEVRKFCEPRGCTACWSCQGLSLPVKEA